MTNKSQIKWSAGLHKRDLADDEDQRANLRVYPSLPYLTSTSLRAAAEIFIGRVPDLVAAQAEAKTEQQPSDASRTTMRGGTSAQIDDDGAERGNLGDVPM
jgi:hypothetical protein